MGVAVHEAGMEKSVMYNHHIEGMASKVAEATGKDADFIKGVLADYWKDMIAITWGIEDVKDSHPEMTDQEARDVLADCLNNHNANIGITWSTIENWENDDE